MERSKFKQGNMKQVHEYCNKLICKGSSWDANNSWKEGDLTWPPRSYTCSFCKREFRSAQALGGHMNVHRRDRARLRLSPTTTIITTTTTTPHKNLHLVDHFTPTSNPNYPSLFTKFPQFASTLPPKRFEDEGIQMKGHFGVRKFCGGGVGSSGVEVDHKNKGVRLELEIGLISHGQSKKKDQELDLELRLGYT